MPDILQPKPKPGPFVGPVNVVELNRILLDLRSRIEAVANTTASAVDTAAGYWEHTVTAAGSGDYAWDTEKSATSGGYFGRQSSNTQVVLLKSGLYAVFATLRARSDGASGVIATALSESGVSTATTTDTLAVSVTGTASPVMIVRAYQDNTTYVSAALTTGDRRFAGSQLAIVKIA